MTLHQYPKKDCYAAAEISIDGRGIFRVSTASQPQKSPRGIFDISDPTMMFEPTPKLDIALQPDREQKVQFKYAADTFVDVPANRAFPRTTVRLGYIVSTLGGSEFHTYFLGRVARVTRNPNAEEGDRVSFVCYPLTKLLDVSLGLLVTPQCPYTFGGKLCKAIKRVEYVLLRSMSGRVATIAPPQAQEVGRYVNGYITQSSDPGVQIPIRGWDPSEPTRLLLRRRPPPSWIGSVITMVEGCGKTGAACDEKGNTRNHGGSGRKIPPYNPLISLE